MRAIRGSGPPIVFSGPAIATPEERRAFLTNTVRHVEEGPYPIQAAIAAADQLNKLDQLYVQKQEFIGHIVIEYVGFNTTETVVVLNSTETSRDATDT